jgi:hypothetical protein
LAWIACRGQSGITAVNTSYFCMRNAMHICRLIREDMQHLVNARSCTLLQ